MRFSYSQLHMFLKCGEQYRRRYVQGEKLPPRVSMIRGSGQHKAQEVDLQSVIDTGALAPEEEVLQVAADTIHEEMAYEDQIDLNDEERERGFHAVRDEAVDFSVRGATVHHLRVAPEIQPKFIEQSMVFSIPGVESEVIAYADVIEHSGRILDTKNTTKSPNSDDPRAKVKTYNKVAQNSDQLALYSLAYTQSTGESSPEQALDFLIIGQKKGDRVVRATANHGPDDQARVALRAQEAAAAIGAGYFPPAPEGSWWCERKWCGYFDTCPYVRGGAVVTVPGINDGEKTKDELIDDAVSESFLGDD